MSGTRKSRFQNEIGKSYSHIFKPSHAEVNACKNYVSTRQATAQSLPRIPNLDRHQRATTWTRKMLGISLKSIHTPSIAPKLAPYHHPAHYPRSEKTRNLILCLHWSYLMYHVKFRSSFKYTTSNWIPPFSSSLLPCFALEQCQVCMETKHWSNDNLWNMNEITYKHLQYHLPLQTIV
jgi:hypothetical protein